MSKYFWGHQRLLGPSNNLCGKLGISDANVELIAAFGVELSDGANPCKLLRKTRRCIKKKYKLLCVLCHASPAPGGVAWGMAFKKKAKKISKSGGEKIVAVSVVIIVGWNVFYTPFHSQFI